MPANTLVFDLGKVVLDFDYQRFFRALEKAGHPAEPAKRVVWECYQSLDLERGLSDFELFYRQVSERLGLKMPRAEFTLAWQDIFTLNQPVVDLINKLDGRPRYLLSNTNSAHAEWIRSRFAGALNLFDHCFFSNELKLVKPEPAIYRAVEAASGAVAHQHLFFDDLAANIEGARLAGWQAVQFLGAEPLRAELVARGLIGR